MAIVFFLGILILDQIAKLYVRLHFMPGESVPVIPHIFHFTYVLNPGAAFGMFAHARWFFIVAGVALVVLAVLAYPRLRREAPMIRYGALALVAGALGNLIDRIATGLVVDFFDLRIWPVFNIADIAICAGVFCMILAILFPNRFGKGEIGGLGRIEGFGRRSLR